MRAPLAALMISIFATGMGFAPQASAAPASEAAQVGPCTQNPDGSVTCSLASGVITIPGVGSASCTGTFTVFPNGNLTGNGTCSGSGAAGPFTGSFTTMGTGSFSPGPPPVITGTSTTTSTSASGGTHTCNTTVNSGAVPPFTITCT
ncbi:hypothetical protein [Streptomyces sp. CT34]|uniref:hypothetical protein n=1 Tax=Streptomyces sp. CT34 TaxID=1553907 RepID=UPI0012FF3E24|nr:hypothetical protein [Streptomyces sp. CT34]